MRLKPILGVAATTITLFVMATPAHAAPKQDVAEKAQGNGPVKAQNDHDGDADHNPATAYTEDNDTNDGGTPNNVVDNGDNAHPSGNDRSVEPGGSGNQGKAESDPDDNGLGPDRSNGGPDKPNGSGGVDKADQDGNNGCGNDDDFEDDNEGWCGHKPTNQPPPPTDVCPNLPGNQATVPSGMIKNQAGNCVTPTNPPTDVCPNINGNQATVPSGMTKDNAGNCVTPPPPNPPVPPTPVVVMPVTPTPSPVVLPREIEKPQPVVIVDKLLAPPQLAPNPPMVKNNNFTRGMLPRTGFDPNNFLLLGLGLPGIGTVLTKLGLRR
jgi:hypothetical protein